MAPRRRSSAKTTVPACTGQKVRAGSKSDYAVALAEKQKLRYQYGVLEKQFRRYFTIGVHQAVASPARFSSSLLETRLDNVIFRLGFANSRSAARQMVSHGHVQVNGRKVDISSFNVRAGDAITIKDKPQSRRLAAKNLELTQITPIPDWLTVNKDQFGRLRFPASPRVKRLPRSSTSS